MGNRFKRCLTALLLILLTHPITTNAIECEFWAAKIASVQGNIEARKINTTNWLPVKRNDLFCAGDSLRSGNNSRAAIILANETLLRLNQNSAINLIQFKTNNPSILEFIKGIGHFISRVPRSLKIETATVHAAIEGTEFVINVTDDETRVTVFEGTVVTQNEHGKVRITNGESVIARINSNPVKTLLAKPRDTVQWALYFPPVIELQESSVLSSASQLLYFGRSEEAKALLQNLNSSESLALQSVIAVVNNDQILAYKLASNAVELTPTSSAAHLAMSYAWQAKLDLKQALASVRQAVTHEPENAIAWARFAELQLSTGDLDNALQSATNATSLNNQLSRTQSILGFAHLVRIDLEKAIIAFNQATELDQVDPLPHLGLGLAMIRKNHLKEGRRELEIAASLDPNSAIIRSYLGKAYFEEERGPLDAIQFDMAKRLDSNDPTPWFYDAIRKQSENDPVGALEDLTQSIKLNDNRAVYRSSLHLDQDEAARSARLARIYQDLGFDQLALLEASHSLESDPANNSALRFLSDSYSNKPRHEIARVSALLQSQLLQPLDLTPVQPQLRETNLNLISDYGARSIGFKEFTSLFTKNQMNLNASVVSGSNNLRANEVILSSLSDHVAFSLGQFSYQSDGWRDNTDVGHDIYNAFIQFKTSQNLDIQFEYINRSTDQGDLRMSLEPSPEFLPTNRGELDEVTARFGLHYMISPASDFIYSYINLHRDAFLVQGTAPLTFHTVTKPKSDSHEIQYILNRNSYNLIAGAGKSTVEGFTNTDVLFNNLPVSLGSPVSLESDQYNVYLYSQIELNDNINILLGVSYDDIDRNNRSTDDVNPKLGLTWDINQALRLRFAFFETVKRDLIANQTIEPTEISGVIQFYDDLNDTKSSVTGIGIDSHFSNQLYTGIDLQKRDMEIPQTSGAITTIYNQNESTYRLYLNYLLSKNLSLSLDYNFEEIKNEVVDPIDLQTTTIPLSLNFSHSNRFFSAIKITHIDQTGQYFDPAPINYTERFNLTDLSLGYRLPNKLGSLNLQINNVFDKEFVFQDYFDFRNDFFNFNNRYIPEINIYGEITLNF